MFTVLTVLKLLVQYWRNIPKNQVKISLDSDILK